MTEETPNKSPDAGFWRRFGSWLSGLWRSFLSALQPPEPDPIPEGPSILPPPTGRVAERHKLSMPIVVPARGHVFDFHINATFLWSAHGIHRETLTGATRVLMPFAVRALAAVAAKHARDYTAHRAGDLERDLQADLAHGGPWCYERNGVTFTCQPQVWVQLDPRVKQAVQPYWEKLITLECEHDVDVMRAQYTDRLARQWREVLEELVTSQVAGGAAQMTDDQLASVVSQLMSTPQVSAEEPEKLMAEQSGDPQSTRESPIDQIMEQLRRARGKSTEARNGAGPGSTSTGGVPRQADPA